MGGRARVACWTAGLAIASLACGGPAQWRYEAALERSAEPAAHGVHEDRLAVLMRDLDRLREERLPQAFDVRGAEEREVREIARVLLAMAASAKAISAAEPAGLDAAEREDFRARAESLQRSASQLAEAAPRLSVREIRSRLVEIDSTCNGCHGRFRIPRVAPGPK